MNTFIIAFGVIWVVVLFIKSQEDYPEDPPRGPHPPYQTPPHHLDGWEDGGFERDPYLRDRRDYRRGREPYAHRARRHYRRRR